MAATFFVPPAQVYRAIYVFKESDVVNALQK